MYLLKEMGAFMQGPTMWIILGVLIAVVIGFLIVSAILDKKKRKQQLIAQNKEKEQKEMSAGKIAIIINILVALNKEKLKNFQPSIGKVKMSDINNLAKKELDNIKKSALYKNILSNEEVLKHFLVISKTKSNNWEKQSSTSLAYFLEYEKGLKDKSSKYSEFKKQNKTRLAKEYK